MSVLRNRRNLYLFTPSVVVLLVISVQGFSRIRTVPPNKNEFIKKSSIFVANEIDLEISSNESSLKKLRKDVLSDHEEVDIVRRSLDTVDYPSILSALANMCQTKAGRSIVLTATDNYENRLDCDIGDEITIIDMPLTSSDYSGCVDRYDALREYNALISGEYPDVQSPAFNTDLHISPLFEAAEKGAILECDDVRQISQTLKVITCFSSWIDGINRINTMEDIQQKFDHLPKFGEFIYVDEDLLDLLDGAFDKEGQLSSKTFPELGRLRKEIAILRKQVLSKVESLLKSSQFSNMLEGSYYSEMNGRFVFPVKATYKNTVGIVHDSSRTGKTVYVEPKEVVEPTNEMKQIELMLKQEETRILRSLSSKIMRNRDDIELSIKALAQIDLIIAKSKFQSKIEGRIPIVEDDGIIEVYGARHPVLLLKGNDVVPNDISIGKDGNRGMIISGPNSGGKTIVLKLFGLLSLMCRDGIPLPISSGRVDFFDPILADIGDMQNVNEDLSTFSGHLLVCKNVLDRCKSNSLVLMDEMGSGTDPKQGVALARSLLESMIDKGAKAIITTHYYELKQYAVDDPRLTVCGMEFDGGYPTYRIIPDFISESYALAVAQRLKLPPNVINRAEGLLDEETRRLGNLLTELEEKREEVLLQQEQLLKKQEELVVAKREVQEIKLELEVQRKSVRQEEAKKFTKLLDEKEKKIREIMNSMSSKKSALNSLGSLQSVKKDVLDSVDPNIRPTFDPLPPDDKLSIGMKVMVSKEGQLYQRIGPIVKMTPKFIEVSFEGMTQRMKRNQLTLPVKVGTKTKVSSNERKSSIPKAVRRAAQLAKEDNSVNQSMSKSKRSDVTIRTQSNTLDLRGKNLSESKEMAVNFFAKKMSSKVVFLLHGHGEKGILKNKLRDWLRTEKEFVQKYAPASQEDGGDAYTIVHLKALF